MEHRDSAGPPRATRWPRRCPPRAPAGLMAAYDDGVRAVRDRRPGSPRRPGTRPRLPGMAGRRPRRPPALHRRGLSRVPGRGAGEQAVELMAAGAPAPSIARKLARQNAAELAVLPDAPPGRHIAAFASRRRATRPGSRRCWRCRTIATEGGSSPWPAWPGPPAWNGTCTPGTWPARWEPDTSPPGPSRCGPRGWPASRTSRCCPPPTRGCGAPLVRPPGRAEAAAGRRCDDGER